MIQIQPVLTPVCFVITWTLIALFFWNIWEAARQGINNVKRMHQIPCSKCEYFTDDYILKCTVHPHSACTEEAIGCTDFCPQDTCLTCSS
ncbi:MAG TPA: hypothetical protein DEV81_16990 [Cyanobacteria bacterium UBA11049]|nr:hypothetical protein [Cyanobacteria bacterium UBA11049]